MRATSCGPPSAGLYAPGTVLTLPSMAAVVGQQLGEQVGEQVGVAQPLRVAPVGQVHLLLHAGSVEGAIGESVDGEDVHPVAVEEVPEFGQRGGFGQFGGRTRRQTQADAEIAVGHQPVADRDHVAVEVRTDLGPRLSGMDVAAVGEMDAGTQIHVPSSCRRSQTNARRISWASI